MIRKTREPSNSSPSPTATYPCRVVQTDNISLRRWVALHCHTLPSLCEGPAHDRSKSICTSKLGSTRLVQEPSKEYLGGPVRHCVLSWAPTKSWVAGAWQMVTNPRLAGQWALGICRDVATRARLSRLDRRSLCGSPDPRPGPAASEISQLRCSGGLQSIKNGTNDQELSSLAGRPVHVEAGQSAHLSSPRPSERSKDRLHGGRPGASIRRLAGK